MTGAAADGPDASPADGSDTPGEEKPRAGSKPIVRPPSSRPDDADERRLRQDVPPHHGS